MDKQRLQELAGVQINEEKFDDHSEEELFQELLAQFKNMKEFIPTKTGDALKAEVKKNKGAYVGIARDIIEVVKQMEKKGIV